jgi:hypothetical protein
LVFGTIGDKRWWPCKAVFIFTKGIPWRKWLFR